MEGKLTQKEQLLETSIVLARQSSDCGFRAMMYSIKSPIPFE